VTLDRRRFLALGSLALVGSACRDARGGRSARSFLDLAEATNERVERALQHRGARDLAPAGARDAGQAFPRYFISREMPVWDPAVRGVWQLEVAGLVKTPLRLTIDDLTALPRATQRVNHYCVEGWTAVATWTGVRVSDLARAAGMLPDAQYVDFESFDSGYHESWDLESALHPQTLVAYGMDGGFLGPGHGAPARLHSPIKLGYKSVKYLTRVVFLPTRTGGYWSDQGYEWHAGV
jgi:DMSO/TMAO reductase YedYZ molybdopterin-dependent catalytic subunit